MKLRVKKSEFSYILFVILFGVLFFHRFLVEIGFPDFMRYSLDVINVVLFVYAIGHNLKIGKIGKIMIFMYLLIILFGTIASLLNIGTWESNALYYIFDCRSLLRYLLFFLSCISLLREKDIHRLFRLILGFNVINSVYIVYQYFTLEVVIYWMRGDNLNGFFGTATGGNIYVNALMVCTTIIVLYQWSHKLCSTKAVIFFIGLNLIVSVLIELKAVFVEIVIVALAFAWSYRKRLTHRQLMWGIIIVIVGILSFIILAQQLYRLYPWMTDTLSLKTMLELSRTTNGTEIGRFTFLTDIVSLIYKGDWLASLLGVGLGTASTNGKMTVFAQTFYNLHYSWYSVPYMFIETGIFGLIAYFYSFITVIINTKKSNRYYQIAISCVLASIFILFYNEAFKTEAGYLLYFLLALPFVKEETENTLSNANLVMDNEAYQKL